jgi:hypothetical protein
MYNPARLNEEPQHAPRKDRWIISMGDDEQEHPTRPIFEISGPHHLRHWGQIRQQERPGHP